MGAAGILRRAAVQAPDLAQAVAAVYAADVKIAGMQDAGNGNIHSPDFLFGQYLAVGNRFLLVFFISLFTFPCRRNLCRSAGMALDCRKGRFRLGGTAVGRNGPDGQTGRAQQAKNSEYQVLFSVHRLPPHGAFAKNTLRHDGSKGVS